MNGKERALSVLSGRSADRPPVFASTLAGAAWMQGVPQKRFHTEAAVLARCVVAATEALGLDGVYVSSDNWILHEALGGEVLFPDDDEPWGRGHLVADWSGLRELRVPDPERDGRMPMLLAAARQVVDLVGDRLYVEANIDSGPFQLAATLRGPEQAMLDLHDRPDRLRDLIEFGTEVVIAYGKAMARTGVHAIQFGEGSAGLIDAGRYRELVQEADRKVIAALQAAGVHAFLHVCGDSRHLLAALAETGPDCLELDARVDLRQAFAAVGSRICLRGNVDTMLLLNGPAEAIRQAAAQCLADARAANGRFVLSPGCGVPKYTPPAHVRALVDAAAG